MEETRCLFCNSLGPNNTVEHIVPESLGNTEMVLKNQVCDSCQNYFGKEIENYVLSKTPIAFWRAYLGIKTKKGNLPFVDLSLSESQKGRIPEYSKHHDNKIGFESHEDGTTSVFIDDSNTIRDILNGERNQFQFVLSPKHLIALGRFLGKIGIELLCTENSENARSAKFDAIRSYIRYGIRKEIWPIFYSQIGNLKDLKWLNISDEEQIEEVLCYEYSLIVVCELYTLLSFRIGTDNWVICLNDPYPRPIIKKAFPQQDLRLIWYSREEWFK